MVTKDIRVCKVDGCENAHFGRGWCCKHYTRWKRYGDVTIVHPNAKKIYFDGMTCEVDGCDRPPRSRGLCGMHYQRWCEHGDPGGADLIKGKLPRGEAAFKHLLSRYKRDAKRRGYDWEISKQQFRDLTQMSCHYCGSPPSNISKGNGGQTNGTYIYSGVDRIDSNKGYESDNCVPCCATCNTAKSTMPTEDFLHWITRTFWHQAQTWEMT